MIDALAEMQTNAIPISPVSLQIGGCTLGPPISCNGKGFPANDGTNPNGATAINYGLPNTVSADNAVVKIDDHVSDRNVISGRYFFGNNSGTVSDAQQIQARWLTQIHTRAQVFGANWTLIPSSRLVNEFRFGYNRLYQPTFTADHNVLASSYGLDTGVTNPLYGGLPRINIAGCTSFRRSLVASTGRKYKGRILEFSSSTMSPTSIGKHALKFGGEIHRDSFSGGAMAAPGEASSSDSAAEQYTIAWKTSSADFPCSASILVGDPTRHIHNWGFAGFVQDDWRIARNLTLNLGLRYEVNTVIKESHNLLGNFDPSAGLEQVGKQIGSPFQGDHKYFAPALRLRMGLGGNGYRGPRRLRTDL